MEALQAGDPREVGPYVLLGRLGAGGMGRVYLGRGSSGRTVAVKLVRPDLLQEGGPEFRRRFAREVGAARAVDAEFTAPVVDADPDADVPWLATAYIPGLALDEAVARFGPLPEASLRHLAAGLLTALSGIHAAGLVHRDLKPSNIMLAVDGPKVIDFGIALLSGATSLTRTAQTVGTLGFMSPEQFERSDVGPESDLFSCGAVLAYAATGRAPFAGDTLPVLIANLTMRDPDLDGAPPTLLPLLRAVLAKDPKTRPTSAQARALLPAAPTMVGPDTGWLPAAVSHALLRIATVALDTEGASAPQGVPAAQLPTLTRPETPPLSTDPRPAPGPDPDTDAGTPEPPATSSRFLTRRRALWLGAGAAVAAAAGGTAVALIGSGSSSSRLRWKVEATNGAFGSPVVVDDVLYVATDEGAVFALDARTGRRNWSVTVGSSFLTTPTVADGTVFVGTGDKKVYALDANTGAGKWSFTTGGANYKPTVVGNGLVYVGSSDNLLYALAVSDGTKRWTAPSARSGPPTSATLALNGNVLCANGYGFQAVDALTGGRKWSRDASDSYVLTTVGPTVYTTDGLLSAVALDVATGAEKWKYHVDGENPELSGMAVAGELVYLCGEKLWALDANSGAQRWTFVPDGHFRRAPTIGYGIAYVASEGGYLYALNAATGAKLWSFRSEAHALIQCVPALTGELVYFGNPTGLYALNM
ncbi:PQQ-binding-like beta-propeller repeat protein [Yinghuangia seranimata]|uniref:outer membrane protein assembly factor BamB family protein n=1 Tax=Yinghuangia seranimata TaxID=408067 RepID=UPI00248C92E4|nr:PQQ-binding-like beta-propeller repeat protein [Yinghuangia seranimata]MDI2129036.1 PQQ-binding-like beta-propeller repeat protein [Yinghuangia seranimata]